MWSLVLFFCGHIGWSNSDLIVTGSSNPVELVVEKGQFYKTAVSRVDQVGARFIHSYKILNSYDEAIAVRELVINWPTAVSNPKGKLKWLTYPTENPQVSGSIKCYNSPRFVNPLNLTEDKADISGALAADITQLSRALRRQFIKLDCHSSRVECVQLYCDGQISPHSEITIALEARIWNVTFARDLSGFHEVYLGSHIEIRYVLDSGENVVGAAAETVIVPEAPAVPKNSKWVAVLLGIIVAVLIVLGLIIFYSFRKGVFQSDHTGKSKKLTRKQAIRRNIRKDAPEQETSFIAKAEK